MRNDPLTGEGPPGEHQEETGDGPVVGLSAEQVHGIRPFFPKERSGKRMDDRKVLSGIIPVIQKGLRWVDAPRQPMAPTKPSTTIVAAGETRVCLI